MPITSDVLIGLLFLACVASVPLAGGRLARLSTLQFRAPWILMAAIAGQVLIVSVFPGSGSEALHTTVHIGTYVIAAVFVVLDRHIPWVWLVALGGALNFTAIAANGGVMPAAPRALEKAGFALDPAGFTNSGAVAHPHLQFLGDVSGSRAHPGQQRLQRRRRADPRGRAARDALHLRLADRPAALRRPGGNRGRIH